MNCIRWTQGDVHKRFPELYRHKGTQWLSCSGALQTKPAHCSSPGRTTVWSKRHRTNIVFSWTSVWNIITTSRLMLVHDTHLKCSYACENPQRLNYLNKLFFHDSLQRLQHLAPLRTPLPYGFPCFCSALCTCSCVRSFCPWGMKRHYYTEGDMCCWFW